MNNPSCLSLRFLRFLDLNPIAQEHGQIFQEAQSFSRFGSCQETENSTELRFRNFEIGPNQEIILSGIAWMRFLSEEF